MKYKLLEKANKPFRQVKSEITAHYVLDIGMAFVGLLAPARWFLSR